MARAGGGRGGGGAGRPQHLQNIRTKNQGPRAVTVMASYKDKAQGAPRSPPMSHVVVIVGVLIYIQMSSVVVVGVRSGRARARPCRPCRRALMLDGAHMHSVAVAALSAQVGTQAQDSRMTDSIMKRKYSAMKMYPRRSVSFHSQM